MHVTGIIAEYNPFHNGHKYHLDELRKRTDADYLVVAMSGDFLQRGVPAVFDKYTRTKMALDGGADLVLEIPCTGACASAEYFAKAGVSLLSATGVVQTLGYGVEWEDPAAARQLAQLFVSAPDAYGQAVAARQRQGLSFPAARTDALRTLLPAQFHGELSSFLSLPNNILAVEYEKALLKQNCGSAPTLFGCAIRRIGDGYHETHARSRYASATAIRRLLAAGDSILDYIPATTLAALDEDGKTGDPVSENDLSLALYYRLLLLKEEGYAQFADCSHDLSCKIAKHLHEFQDFTQFASLLKSRDLTYTRICRVLIHILLDIRGTDYAAFPASGSAPYLRILGFRKTASPLLARIKKKASAPLISKVADASHILSEKELSLLQKDIFASDLYRAIVRSRTGRDSKNEYTRGVIVR